VGKLNGQDSAFEKQGFLSSRDPKYSDKPEASAQSMLRQPQQSSFSKVGPLFSHIRPSDRMLEFLTCQVLPFLFVRGWS
jgi:hypothetical protein